MTALARLLSMRPYWHSGYYNVYDINLYREKLGLDTIPLTTPIRQTVPPHNHGVYKIALQQKTIHRTYKDRNANKLG
jgi:hypothetical protein